MRFVYLNFFLLEHTNIQEEMKYFIGNGFDLPVNNPLKFLGNTREDTHYLVLSSGGQCGFQCYINLFNTFKIGVRLSKKAYNIPGRVLIGINDIHASHFELDTLEEYFCKYMQAFPLELYTAHGNLIEYNTDLWEIPLYYKSGRKALDNLYQLPRHEVKIKQEGNDIENFIMKANLRQHKYYIKDKNGKLKCLYYFIEINKRRSYKGENRG